MSYSNSNRHYYTNSRYRDLLKSDVSCYRELCVVVVELVNVFLGVVLGGYSGALHVFAL